MAEKPKIKVNATTMCPAAAAMKKNPHQLVASSNRHCPPTNHSPDKKPCGWVNCRVCQVTIDLATLEWRPRQR